MSESQVSDSITEGDNVVIAVEASELQQLQKSRSGWAVGMTEVSIICCIYVYLLLSMPHPLSVSLFPFPVFSVSVHLPSGSIPLMPIGQPVHLFVCWAVPVLCHSVQLSVTWLSSS